jgi:acetate kinase
VIVLALNSGSSSLKFGLYRTQQDAAEPLLTGQLDGIGQLADRLAVAAQGRGLATPSCTVGRRCAGIPSSMTRCCAKSEAASAFAPLHTPAGLAVIAHASELFPDLPQMACFDIAFHATLPDTARVLPIPKTLQAQGIQRYGFHGLSCESILFQLAHELPQGLPERVPCFISEKVDLAECSSERCARPLYPERSPKPQPTS